MRVSFCFHSLRCSEILASPSICTKIRTRRFHRTEEVLNIFSVSWHITHISMAISANLERDTDHNSTKLFCDHPLIVPHFSTTIVPHFPVLWPSCLIFQFSEFRILTPKFDSSSLSKCSYLLSFGDNLCMCGTPQCDMSLVFDSVTLNSDWKHVAISWVQIEFIGLKCVRFGCMKWIHLKDLQ